MKKKFIVFVFITLLSICFSVVCYADCDLPTKNDMEDEREKAFIEDVRIYKTNVAIKHSVIDCFAVSDKYIALGYTSGLNKSTISLYDKDFNFLQSYTIECHGSIEPILYDDYFAIWVVRGGYWIEVDYDANVLNVAVIEDTDENNDYYRNTVNVNEIKNGDKTYKISGVLWFAPYYHFTVTDAQGNSEILYSSAALTLTKIILGIAFSVFCIVSVILRVIRSVKYGDTKPMELPKI